MRIHNSIMSVTQKEIAEKLNISQAHVARALGKNGARVSEETRRRIEAAALEMGYDPEANREARAMAGKRYSRRVRTNIVAIAMPIPDGATPRHIPFYNLFLHGFETEAAAMGNYDTCIVHKRGSEVSRLLRSSILDGAVVAGFNLEQIQLIRAAGLAVVTYQASYPGMSSILPDVRSGMYKTTRYLLELGHRNIAYVGPSPADENHETVVLRLKGYHDALTEAGIPIREEWIETSLGVPDGTGKNYCSGCDCCAACIGWEKLMAKAGVALDQQPPFTAVVCHNDPVAMGVIREAENNGLNIPRDLSVTGFDNVSEHYEFHPQITSVGCSHFEMGRSAMRLLREAIDAMIDPTEHGDIPVENQIFSVDLSVGESTAVPRPT